MCFEATIFHHQLPELEQLAADFPDTTIVLDHMGLALAIGLDPNGRQAVFDDWRAKMVSLARHPNVICKVGGLGTAYWGFGFDLRTDPTTGDELASAWRPYVETAIEAFGFDRCMTESDYPADARSCGFVPLWNALKTIVRSCADDDKNKLFNGTAAKIYRIELNSREGADHP